MWRVIKFCALLSNRWKLRWRGSNRWKFRWRVIKLVEIKVARDQILRTFIKSVKNKLAYDQISGK